MDDRVMPMATFRCDTCQLQSSVRLTRHTRRTDRIDSMSPHPRHHKTPMRPIQIQYDAQEGVA